MNDKLSGQLFNFAFTLLASLLIWNYYRNRTFNVKERYSTFGPRFWSGFVDSCVLWPVAFFISGALLFDVPKELAALLVIIERLVWLVYVVDFHARYGQTVGKMAVKVKVVDFRTEGSISYRQALLREGIPTVLSLGMLGYEVFAILNGDVTGKAISNHEALRKGPLFLLTALPLIWFAVEVLTMLTNDKRRALHDFIAGTVVIRTNISDTTLSE